MADDTGTAPVTDRRPVPRGVIPRRAQTWVMAGLAIGILAIVVLAGHPEPAPPGSRVESAESSVAPDASRLRDYQDRLRVLDARARQQQLEEPRQLTPTPEYAPAAAATGYRPWAPASTSDRAATR